MADKRKPWIKWFTRDWRSNAKLRMCSYGARGLWADMISLMAEAERFGFLIINGVVPTCRQLSGLLGGTEKEVAKLRTELGDANVYSVTGEAMPEDIRALIPPDMPDGVIFSRRMVKDAAKAERDRQNGKGGGNPNLVGLDKAPDNPPDKGPDNPPDKGPVNVGVNPPANPQSQSQNQSKNSEAKASGAGAPLGSDLKARLFGPGVDWLQTVTGKSNARCRSLIGKWRKIYGDDAGLIDLLAEAQRLNIEGPESWFPEAIKHRRALADGDRMPRTAAEAIAMRDCDPAWAGVHR